MDTREKLDKTAKELRTIRKLVDAFLAAQDRHGSSQFTLHRRDDLKRAMGHRHGFAFPNAQTFEDNITNLPGGFY